jgi:hypothetical protein
LLFGECSKPTQHFEEGALLTKVEQLPIQPYCIWLFSLGEHTNIANSLIKPNIVNFKPIVKQHNPQQWPVCCSC